MLGRPLPGAKTRKPRVRASAETDYRLWHRRVKLSGTVSLRCGRALLMTSLGMRRQPNRCVHRTITVIGAPALHHFQKEPIGELLRVDVEKLSASVVPI